MLRTSSRAVPSCLSSAVILVSSLTALLVLASSAVSSSFTSLTFNSSTIICCNSGCIRFQLTDIITLASGWRTFILASALWDNPSLISSRIWFICSTSSVSTLPASGQLLKWTESDILLPRPFFNSRQSRSEINGAQGASNWLIRINTYQSVA